MREHYCLNSLTRSHRMSFTESNTVEQMILDAATSLGSGAGSSVLREDRPAGWDGSLGGVLKWSKVFNSAKQ